MNPDFVIKFNPETETEADLSDRILECLIIRRLRGNKPCVIFIGGQSGEGKSWAGLKVVERLCAIQGIDVYKYIRLINIHTPLEYSEKMEKILFDKGCEDICPDTAKPVNMMVVHEAGELIKAKLWYNFVTMAIADVNKLSRQVKRLCFIIVSQMIKDVTNDVKRTLTYYCEARRPIGHKTKLYIRKVWNDARDINDPKLRTSPIRGKLVYPDGHSVWWDVPYFELDRPDKRLVEIFEHDDLESKTAILKHKLKKLMQAIKSDMDVPEKNLSTIADFYTETKDKLSLIGKYKGDTFKVKKDFMGMHDLDKFQFKEFEKMVNDKLKAKENAQSVLSSDVI